MGRWDLWQFLQLHQRYAVESNKNMNAHVSEQTMNGHSRPQRLRSSWPAPRIETSGRLQFSVRDSRTSDLSAQSRTFIKMVDQAINFGQEIQNFSDIT